MNNQKVILFDGICNLCNRYVQFVIKHDKKNMYKFASLQSTLGSGILRRFALPENNFKTILLVEDNKLFTKSTAILRVAKNLNGIYKAAAILFVIPKPVRDFFYMLVSKNRHRFFKMKNSCLFPYAVLKEKFIE